MFLATAAPAAKSGKRQAKKVLDPGFFLRKALKTVQILSPSRFVRFFFKANVVPKLGPSPLGN